MNILIIGLGSIGQRHLINLKKIKPKANFFVIRKIKKNIVIKNKKLILKRNLLKYYNLKEISLKEADRLKFDLTLICNPTSLHFKYTNMFLKKKSHIFVEKPLFCSLKNLKKIIEINKKIKKLINVGYQFRYHPLIKLVKKIVNSKKFGKVKFANFVNRCFLPDFHPYENYKNSYAASKKLGGGALNTLSHEVDLIAFFFGLPKKYFSFETNSKSLNIKANDLCEATLIYNSNTIVRLSLSLAEKKNKKRYFEIFFENDYMFCDMIKNSIKITSFKTMKSKLIHFKKDINQLYLEEIKSVFKNMKKKFPTEISLEKNLNTEYLINSLKN